MEKKLSKFNENKYKSLLFDTRILLFADNGICMNTTYQTNE